MTSVSTPLVSVIIITYNREKYLKAALQSVFDQDYANHEVILVDDGSTDGTPAIADDLQGQVRYVRMPHRGIPAARNEGVRQAKGQFIAFLDSDDLWEPGKLSFQVSHLQENPACDICFGMLRRFLEPGSALPPGLRMESVTADQVSMSVCVGLIRREVFEQVGEFDETFALGEDSDWMARARDRDCRFDFPERCLARIRIHDANSSHHNPGGTGALLKALRASVQRKKDLQNPAPS
jgi:glycosyltransferase involved in cell wall biosynthesis